MNGAHRFINRVWKLILESYPASVHFGTPDEELERLRHKTIRKVSERVESFRFNTMISSLMEFTNFLMERYRRGKWRTATYHQSLETLLVLLAPAAPFMTDELWRLTGHSNSIHQQRWPDWNKELAQDEVEEIPVQINGRLRDVIQISSDLDQEGLDDMLRAQSRIQSYLVDQEIEKIIYVPGKIINIVAKPVKERR